MKEENKTITEEEVLKIFRASFPSMNQRLAMTYDSGPYEIEKATCCLKMFVEKITGKKVVEK